MFVPTMAVVRGRDGVDVGALVCEAMQKIGMQHKEAAIICGYPDHTQWSKALKGEAPLDWWRMRHLGPPFFEAFLPLFASAKIREWLVEEYAGQRLLYETQHLPRRMAKAELQQQDERKRA